MVSGSTPMGMIIPMYQWGGWAGAPNSYVDAIIQAKQSASKVDFIVVINRNSGQWGGLTGTEQSNWQNLITRLNNAGIRVALYVWWGGNYNSNMDSANSALTGYAAFFLDGYQATSMTTSQQVYNHAHSLGKLLIANPGAPISTSYQSVVDMAILYENYGGSASTIIANTSGWGRSQVGVISHGVPSLPSPSFFSSVSQSAKYVYVTADDNYMAAPSYLTSEANNLNNISP